MYIDSKTARSAYLWHTYKELIEEHAFNISEIAEKMWTSQPNLSNALNWKKSFSDKFFTKIWKAIWLTDKQIKEIFKEADLETLKYKYWEDVLSSKEFSYEELFEMMKEKENLSDEQVKAIQDFIEFQKRQGK